MKKMEGKGTNNEACICAMRGKREPLNEGNGAFV